MMAILVVFFNNQITMDSFPGTHSAQYRRLHGQGIIGENSE